MSNGIEKVIEFILQRILCFQIELFDISVDSVFKNQFTTRAEFAKIVRVLQI